MARDKTSSLPVRNPYSTEVEFEVPIDSPADVERKLERARMAHVRWRETPLEQRMREVSKALLWFGSKSNDVARDITLQMGKPIVQARKEVETMLARAEHQLAVAKYALAPEVIVAPKGFTLRVEHHPLGVVLDIAAWNYPLLVPINAVMPAVLAGNAVLLKHSPLTPKCGQHFEQAFEALSVPGVVQNVVVENERAEELIGDPRIDHLCFTGSVATGRKVYAAAARRMIDAGLELGGKDPAYVAEDADLEFTAETVVDGACYNAGQSCCAVERVYVHKKVYDEFLEKALAVMKGYRLGDPTDERTTMGPLARRENVEVLEKQVADAVMRGARVLTGRRKQGRKGWFFEPTLLADVPSDARVMQDESFGPVLPVAPVEDDDEAIGRMNDSRYGLTASVWTKSGERAERFAHELEAGTVYQNRCDYLDPGLPWTGWKESGIGSMLSRYGFRSLTKRKSVHLRA